MFDLCCCQAMVNGLWQVGDLVGSAQEWRLKVESLTCMHAV